mmetsp:Transcript_95320/g.199369  ORF Transcript_95320/g.199369 Transcript_95320/m.199369 type:complete len:575 (+) Transcript_95320:228-1952(+)|eukprot:CAMPEP_0206457072 /NCGR_PEP_ID=MMETSP0324_2-20121206/22745_1 /ASSEMBLY_ACC=CAM_ASM_000836 /TAXON_ID=2866 /ORGANISM="Crypthecodinium cohnii, Strain Seligo" /LENGTH=574 /DNA_ID=CAMNT_0053928127 /DNA_START=227 /DNA_END=1951 /DNA_ORIENTATION=+
MVKKLASMGKGKPKFARRNLRQAMVLSLRQEEHARRGTSVGAAGREVTSAAVTIPIKQRAGHPLVKTKVKPSEWKTKEGKHITVDFARVPWLPDDYGQGVKTTNPIRTSRKGEGGTYTVWVSPDGDVYYHKTAIEKVLGRKLTYRDGFNGQRRLAQLQGKVTDEKKFFGLLSAAERRCLPQADDLHFCIVSARRTQTQEGLQGIALVQAQFENVGVSPTWYVDEPSLKDYQALGLKAVVGGKLCPARNKCLEDASKLNKACVQVSDDISRWEYYEGEPAVDGSDDACNAAFAAATCHTITPVAAARFLLAKMRAAQQAAAKANPSSSPNTLQGPRLAGVYPLGSCSRAFAGAEVQKQHFIIGDFFVADKSPLRFDQEMTLKEDYDFTANHIYTYGSVLRCTRMTISAKHQTNAGGACAIRDKKGLEEQKNIAILRRKWPRGIRNHPKRKNEVILQWPADGDVKGERQSSKTPVAGGKGKRISTTPGLSKPGGVIKKISKAAEKLPNGTQPTTVVSKGPHVPTSKYIAERVRGAAGKTVQTLMEKYYYTDINGKKIKYCRKDLRYDLMRQFLIKA